MTRRRLVLPVLGLLLAVLGATAGQAQAVGYRYWSFWDRDSAAGTWAYATQGPSTARPSDGDVQGFRFSVSEDSKDSAKPRGAADFATICAKTPAREGSKRVGLVLDFGTAADAPSDSTPPRPRTACARVDDDATTADALAAVAKPLRYDTNALLCAIAGYPSTGCGEPVSGDRPKASASPGEQTESKSGDGNGDGDGGPSVGLLAGIAAVATLGAAAIWQARRRRG
ncbi:SCO2322 family protein [Streptomyces sp. NBC_00878]|uniref:SCO2322 family protein n=1 Tax=Streptomyces sp. NBC_00878 TaxID=2975854 RepID=UPI002250242C|nr:SCO2322 family protein [Streptomyces sp. NBC_00878]MCX4909137.1 SCO2322 family protein [Streptomyces sp. NBC_00878]